MDQQLKRRSIRVLILEDNPYDVEMLLAELRRQRIDFSHTVVQTKETFVDALRADPDIILSDYTLPQYDAPHALKAIQERRLDIPFIVVSGTIGEDKAVDIMRAGANDYLLKDRLSRLGVAIEQSLLVRSERRARALSEAKFVKMARAVEQSADNIVVTDMNGIIEYVNPAFLNSTGYLLEEVLGATPSILKSGRHSQDFYQQLWDTISSGKTFRAEFVNRRKNGELYYEMQGISPVVDVSGAIINFISTGKDITELRRMEDALRESEDRYRNLVESALDAIFTLSVGGEFITLNTAFETITGWSRDQWKGKNFSELLHPDDKENASANFQAVLKGNPIPIREYRISTASGKFLYVEVQTVSRFVDGKVAGVFGIARDVTARKSLEQQFRQAQKMESIGTLAGGIAHDFNNILGIILACTSRLQTHTLNEKIIAKNLDLIQKAVHRGTLLVRQILTFARKHDITLASIDLNDIVTELKNMLKPAFPKTIEIRLRLTPDLPKIVVDPNQVHQAILNLCVNARDAVEERMKEQENPGTITITTEFAEKEELLKKFSSVPEDRYLAVRVSDTGIGMDESTMLRIFDPFYTTKEIGKGTGLGLSVVYGVMQSLHGFAGVDSVLRSGTTFSLYFPMNSPILMQQDSIPSEHHNPSGGDETILVVEDEEELLELLTIVLEEKGYKIFSARTGTAGLKLFKEHSQTIDLVFTDYGLPELNGFTLLQNIMDYSPKTKVLMASGYIQPEELTRFVESGIQDIVPKPYSLSTILTKIRETLDRE